MENSDHIEALKDIRNIMERSSRFLSLSGLSGVYAGVFALIGLAAVSLKFDLPVLNSPDYYLRLNEGWAGSGNYINFFILDACLMLLAALSGGMWLTWQKAKKKGLPMIDATAKRLAINMLIPLITGGLFCLILLKHSNAGLIIPSMLLFYGLALVNASKYTLHDIRYLGILEITLGLFGACFMEYGLLCWALGFGLLHIVYGAAMYIRYER